jgi:hypothetical protein
VVSKEGNCRGLIYSTISWLKHYATKPEGRGFHSQWSRWIFQLT